jgi:hypothetical protein
MREYAHDQWSQGCNDVFNQVAVEKRDFLLDDLLLPLCPFKSLPCNCSPRETMGRNIHAMVHTNRSVISTDLYSYLVLPAEVLRSSYFLANCGTGQVSWMEIKLDPCLYQRIITYLNKPEVQKALHANTCNSPPLPLGLSFTCCCMFLSYQLQLRIFCYSKNLCE